MADWTKFDASLDRVTTKCANDAMTIAAAQQADAAVQSDIDSREAKLAAIAPLPSADPNAPQG